MTREEAIKWLKKLATMKFAWDEALYHKAVGMAIESLEKDGSETNLEHYFYEWAYDDDKVVITFEEDMTKKFLNKGKSCKLKEWLLKPYEPPKCKLSRFEYDLLDNFKEYDDEESGFNNWAILRYMRKKGHYKDIPEDTKIRDILDNCEVIDE